MLAYMCKYAPIEIIEAFGTPVVMMEPHVTSFTQADTLMHPNMCSYVKAVLEEFENNNYEGMIFTTCCDSSRRLYDILQRRFPEKFFFCIDLPRKVNDFSILLYVKQIQKMTDAYAAFSGKSFSPEKLAEMCRKEFEMQLRKKELLAAGMIPSPSCDLNICLAGARPGSGIKRLIKDHGANIALDLTCTGITREYEIDETDILASYTKALLTQIPCMRMYEADSRRKKLSDMKEHLDGIIYHTVKFCDIYSYEYTQLKDMGSLPIVKVETDATSQCAGQILTRVEAFLESLRARKTTCPGHTLPEAVSHPSEGPEKNDPYLSEKQDNCTICFNNDTDSAGRLTMTDVHSDAARKALNRQNTFSESASEENRLSQKGNQPMYIMGIDSGSTSTNAVIINEKKEITASTVVRTGAKSGESAERILQKVLDQAGLNREDLTLIVSTGYGRVSIPFADKNVTEISCHGKGAHFLNPAIRTILDIGGQDSKAIRLNENGDVIDFVMNDKCAAGTGRFLEMMARTLEISIDELGPVSLRSKENIEISSMCSVFAESEVISLIAQNKETADIAHGIHKAIAGKAISLLKRVGLEKGLMMTGGVAKNPGVVKVLEEELGAPLYIYDEPEIVGALGAALFGLESV